MAAAAQTIAKRGEGLDADCGLAFAIEVLQEAERLGFEKTLIAERFLGPDLEAWMLASALAMCTKRLELIVAVHPGIFSPQVTAKMGATLDRLSGGRAGVNLVNGWWQEEFEIFGNGAWLDRSEERYQRMDEFMEVLTRLWTEDGSDFDGVHYRMKNGRLPSTPVTRPNPGVYTASSSPAGQDAIARLGDYWFVVPSTPNLGYKDFDQVADEIEANIAAMRARAAGYGRTIGFGLVGHVICAPTQAEADDRAADLDRYGQEQMMNFIVARGTLTGLVGTPEVIAERLRRYEAMGVSFTMLHFHPMIEGLRTFAAEVMPLLSPAGALPAEPVARYF